MLAYYDLAAHDVTWGERRIPMYDVEYLEAAQYKSYIVRLEPNLLSP